MLELRSICIKLGQFELTDFSLRIENGEYFVLMGPSGVGKTVLLEMICGLLRPDRGQLLWQGQDITTTAPESRRFAVAYQDHALFPHMSVADNLAYGLRARRMKRPQIAERVQSIADLLNIETLLSRSPETLSGGEKQRTSLARALVTEPRLLLLDEPLSSLHGGARRQLRKELQRIHQQTGCTFFHVTHDPQEATYLADRVAVMIDRKIRLTGPPERILRDPGDDDVAELLGLKD